MSVASPIHRASISGLVLAGGRGMRMGAADKGLQLLRGRPLVAHVLDRLAPQVGPVIVNANRNVARYGEFGYEVVGDLRAGHDGPLAGLQAGLAACTTELIIAVPCDAPFLPLDLVARMAAELDRGIDVVTVATPQRSHPVFCMVRRSVRTELDRYLDDGGRAVGTWITRMNGRAVSFADEHAFSNFNTIAELQERPTVADDR